MCPKQHTASHTPSSPHYLLKIPSLPAEHACRLTAALILLARAFLTSCSSLSDLANGLHFRSVSKIWSFYLYDRGLNLHFFSSCSSCFDWPQSPPAPITPSTWRSSEAQLIFLVAFCKMVSRFLTILKGQPSLALWPKEPALRPASSSASVTLTLSLTPCLCLCSFLRLRC